jgi:hypothetical protein
MAQTKAQRSAAAKKAAATRKRNAAQKREGSEKQLEPPFGLPSDGDFWARMKRRFAVGPFAWVTKSLPKQTRFRAGPHMHGLDRHDIVERDTYRKRSESDLR